MHFNPLLPEASRQVSDSPWRPRPVGGTVDSVDALVGRGVELQRHWTMVARQSEWPVGGTCLLYFFFFSTVNQNVVLVPGF